jgi:hypothetical protein
MCDYSLQNVKTRPARIGDNLVTRRFSSATGGFCAPEDIHVAVCLLPGTELSFAYEVRRFGRLWPLAVRPSVSDRLPDGLRMNQVMWPLRV